MPLKAGSIEIVNIAGKEADCFTIDEYAATFPPTKFAPVAPYHIYHRMMEAGYIPDTVLLLAHDVCNHTAEYDDVFSDQRWNNTTIIMDNSLVETGGAVDSHLVFEAAEYADADIVVLPDVMGKGLDSSRATVKAWDDWQWKFRNYQKMVVLHGEQGDFWSGVRTLKDANVNPDWISIPRKSEAGFNDRLRLIDWALLAFPGKPVHLLGFSDFLWCDIIAARHPNVKSIDSAVPLRLKTDNILTEDAGKRPAEWFEAVKFDPKMIDRCRAVDRLISVRTF